MLSKNARIVQNLLEQKGYAYRVQELSENTHTAQDAANALHCLLEQIVKSIVFITASGQSILVLVNGSNTVNIDKLETEIKETVTKANASTTKELTGFPIGGVPPLGHKTPPSKVLIDPALFKHAKIWAAAGTPRAVFELDSDQLERLSGGQGASIT